MNSVKSKYVRKNLVAKRHLILIRKIKVFRTYMTNNAKCTKKSKTVHITLLKS
jgi:hypothetical protein